MICSPANANTEKRLTLGQRTNQKYRNLVGSDQQMQRLEETELRKADRTVRVSCNIISNISSGTA